MSDQNKEGGVVLTPEQRLADNRRSQQGIEAFLNIRAEKHHNDAARLAALKQQEAVLIQEFPYLIQPAETVQPVQEVRSDQSPKTLKGMLAEIRERRNKKP